MIITHVVNMENDMDGFSAENFPKISDHLNDMTPLIMM
jgi:hypothetical protein